MNPPMANPPVPLRVTLDALPTLKIEDDESLVDWVNMLLAIALTGVTCVAVLFSKQLNDETKRNAAAMAATSEAQLRPYVMVSDGTVASFGPASSGGTYLGKFQIELKNVGATIAKAVAFEAEATLVPRGPGATTPARPTVGTATFPLAPGGTIKGTFDFPPLSASDLAEVRSGDMLLFLRGAIEYTDSFMKTRGTSFCYTAPPLLQAGNKLGYWGEGNDAT